MRTWDEIISDTLQVGELLYLRSSNSILIYAGNINEKDKVYLKVNMYKDSGEIINNPVDGLTRIWSSIKYELKEVEVRSDTLKTLETTGIIINKITLLYLLKSYNVQNEDLSEDQLYALKAGILNSCSNGIRDEVLRFAQIEPCDVNI